MNQQKMKYSIIFVISHSLLYQVCITNNNALYDEQGKNGAISFVENVHIFFETMSYRILPIYSISNNRIEQKKNI